FGGRHSEQSADLRATAGFPEDGDIPGIATERFGVVPDPFERKNDVQQARDAGAGELFPADVGEMQVAENVEPMINGNDYDVAPGCEGSAVVPGFRTSSRGVSPSVKPDHHGALRRVDSRSPDVEDEAVFTKRQHWKRADRALVGERLVGDGARLRADWPEFGSITGPRPWLGGDRRQESTPSRGRRAVWDSLERRDTIVE